MVPQMLAEGIWWIGGTMLTTDSEVLGGKPVPLPLCCSQKTGNNRQGCRMVESLRLHIGFMKTLSVLLIRKARFQLHMPQASDNPHFSESMGVALWRHRDTKRQYYSYYTDPCCQNGASIIIYIRQFRCGRSPTHLTFRTRILQ